MRTTERRLRLHREARLVTADHESSIIGEIYPIVGFVLARTGQTSEHIPIGHRRRHRLRPDERHAWCEDCQETWPCSAIREEATRFDDHPDYREEWRL